jgi:hypothetical protein
MPKLLPSIENVAEGGCASPETFSNQAGTSTVLGIPLRDYQSGSTSSIRVLEDRGLSLSLSLSLSLPLSLYSFICIIKQFSTCDINLQFSFLLYTRKKVRLDLQTLISTCF